MILMNYIQNFNFAWGVGMGMGMGMGIFRGEERSEIWRYLGRFRNAPGWPDRKTQAWQDQDFFQNFHHREWGGEEGSCLYSRSCIA